MNPCCKISVFNGAFYMAIADIVYTSLASIIIILQIINSSIYGESINNFYNLPEEDTSITKVLIAYLFISLVNFILSIILYQGITTENNIKKCYTFLILSSLSTFVGLSTVIYHGFYLYNLHMSLFNTEFFILLVYHLYKIYLLMVVGALVQEIINISNSSEDGDNTHHNRHMYELLESTVIGDEDETADQVANVFYNEPFAARHCILEENLKIDYDTCIEYNEKTSTVKGLLQQPSNSERDVAVKILKSNFRSEKCMTELVKEARLLLNIGSHQHIIQLLGVCSSTTPTKGENITLILESFPPRKLDDFLRSCFENRLQNFQNMLSREDTQLRRQSKRLGTVYENLPMNYYQTEPFSTMTMAQWAYQLSSAMDYLHNKNIILGNLQAKSLVLVRVSNIKLSNFSFASELRENNNKISSTEMPGRVSWRWTALECLSSTNAGLPVEFNEKTDIWSYGSTIYEIFNMGYSSRMSPNLHEYIGALKKGFRPEKPQFAPDGVYNLMKTCWSHETSERPSFKFISLFFSQLISTSIQKFY